MGNSIILQRNGAYIGSLKMNNSLTSIFVDVLVLSGSHLASTEYERDLVVFIASADQNVYGIGTVGFDLREMPWSPEHFEPQRSFLLKSVEAAMARTGWDRLSYQPNEDWLFESLQSFEGLIRLMSVHDVDPSAREKWLADNSRSDQLCHKHNALTHSGGCVICNDETGGPLYGSPG